MDPDLVVEDGRIAKGSLKGGTVLHYYAAVNAKLGVVYFCWVTGTTDKPKVYLTRVSNRSIHTLLPCMPCHASVIVTQQPQPVSYNAL